MNHSFFPQACQGDSLLQKHDTEYSKKDRLQYEGARLSTFATFPDIAGVYATKLAGAGFYYVGKGDEVVCFSCNMSYKNWKRSDSPKEIHKRCSPFCNFIQNKRSEILIISNAIFAENNISTVSNGSQINASESDITFTRVSQTHLSSNDSNSQDSNRQSFLQKITNDVSTDTQASLEPITPNLGICFDKPKYQKYAVRTQRLSSFLNWPSYLTQSPDEMASAGFFFTGMITRCL